MTIKAYSKSVIGGREMNQDACLIEMDLGVFAVADGVGGGERGEVASAMSVEGLKAHPKGSPDLRSTFLKIQESVYSEAMRSVGEPIMGSTLTAVMISEGKAYLCHVGDSRCYLYENEVLRQMTEDHEVFDENYQAPVLASYMGIPMDIHPLTIQEESFPLVPGNRLLLCSDGLYKQITETRMAALIREEGEHPEILLDRLCTEAAEEPYSDNITIVYIEID